MATVVTRAYAPSMETSIVGASDLALPDHSVQLSISVDYKLDHLPKSEDQITRKYYITYSIGGQIEGKTENLTAGQQKWIIQHDLNVNHILLLNLYQNPTEFVLWEVVTNPKPVGVKKKAKQQTEEKKVTKTKKSIINPDAIQMSLANTGIIRKHPNKKKSPGKFIATKDEVVSKDQEESNELERLNRAAWRGKSESNPNLGEITRWNRRPGSASPIMSRPASSNYSTTEHHSSAGRTSPHPHHYDHPEKHIDGALIISGLVRSRSSSMTNLLHALRPRTPPSPHHSDHPLKTIKKSDSRPGSSAKKQVKIEGGAKAEGTEGKSTYVRWGRGSGGTTTTSAHSSWDQFAVQSVLRQENDFPIQRSQATALGEKKKGDSLHVPIERVNIDLGSLFIDSIQVGSFLRSSRLHLSDCVLHMSLDNSLLSAKQKELLNPIVIKLGEVEGMPADPIPYKILDEIARPIYAKFRFLSDPFIHTATISQVHGKTLSFNSEHVILAGLLDPKKILDDMIHRRLIIEIHDRDYKYSKEVASKTANFLEGGVIQANLNPTNSYGQAVFDLNEIRNGNTSVKLETIILPSPRAEKRLMKGSILQGRFFEASSVFSIQINMDHSLPEFVQAFKDGQGRHKFSTVAIVCRKALAVKKVLDFITDFNCSKLNLQGDRETRENLLCSFEFSKPVEDQHLDLLSGYHVFDVSSHVLYIEGLCDGGIKKIISFIEGEMLTSNHANDRSNEVHNTSSQNIVLIQPKGNETFARQRVMLNANIMHILLSPSVSSIMTWTKRKTYIDAKLYECLNMFNRINTANPDLLLEKYVVFPSQKVLLPLLKTYGSIRTQGEIFLWLERQITESKLSFSSHIPLPSKLAKLSHIPVLPAPQNQVQQPIY